LPGVKENIPLAKYTSFKIGGPAKYFFIAKTKEDLITALKVAKENKLKVFILGGGSNVLVSENGFDGLVVKIEISDIKFAGDKVLVGAGINSSVLAHNVAEKGLSGLEWMAGLPGTIGGAIYGNAYAFGSGTENSVESVEVLDINTHEVKNFSKEDCLFGVKNSIFKKSKQFVILSSVLKLNKGNTEDIRKKNNEYLKYRQDKHPMNFPSAGSVFVNPDGHNSWQLIHDCGLTGKIIGQAQISEKHSNFIVNLGGAKADDVLELIKLVQKEVKEKFNIKLETEIQIIGF